MNMKPQTRNLIIIWLLLTGLPCIVVAQTDTTYKIVGTGQIKCYNDSVEITCLQPGESFYGQDANYTGNTSSYTITKPAPEPLEVGDANCDEVVDIADVVCLINYLFTGGPSPGDCR
jgi:hypothetical protein